MPEAQFSAFGTGGLLPDRKVRALAEANSIFYKGSALSARGEKDRFVLPQGFRKPVQESSGGRYLCLSWHDNLPCLIGYGLSRMAELEAEIDRDERLAVQRGEPFEREAAATAKFGSIEEVGFDSSGRFVIPRHLQKLGKMDGTVFFHGAGRYFFIWNPDVLGGMGAEHGRAKAMLEILLEEEGG